MPEPHGLSRATGVASLAPGILFLIDSQRKEFINWQRSAMGMVRGLHPGTAPLPARSPGIFHRGHSSAGLTPRKCRSSA
jgi:hypothetical protein